MPGWARAPMALWLCRRRGRLGTALRCSVEGGRDSANPAQPHSAVGSRCRRPGLCQAVPGPEGVPWLFPALVGLGVSWRLCVTVTVLRGGILGDSPGCLWGCRGHTAGVSSSREESRMGCGAVRGHRYLSLGSVLWRVPLLPSWVGAALGSSSSSVGVTVSVCTPGCAWLGRASPCCAPVAAARGSAVPTAPQLER